jgi:hypothetical protein
MSQSQIQTPVNDVTDRWLEATEQAMEQAKATNEAEQQVQDQIIKEAIDEFEVSGTELLRLLEDEGKEE